MIGASGEADRGAIAEIVFADRRQLEWLEALLHPRVVREYLAWRDELRRSQDPPAVCATEAPLLFETGGQTRFDAVVTVTAPEEARTARANVDPDGREQRLVPEEEKVRLADYAYVNDGTLEDLDRFVGGVVAELGG